MDGSPPVSSRVSPTSGVFFLYAGQPGRKDRLVSFIRVLPRIQEALGRPVVLHVAGLDDRELQQLLLSDGMDLAAYRTLIECHGRVARERVSELYRQSHFSILFREDKRYAHAGFPTKAVESWSHGCPVILNPVGDVGKLARHMVDAIVVDEDRLEVQLVPALQASSDPDRYSMMFAKSREKAGRLFSLEAYQLAFTRFAERLGIRLERHG